MQRPISSKTSGGDHYGETRPVIITVVPIMEKLLAGKEAV